MNYNKLNELIELEQDDFVEIVQEEELSDDFRIELADGREYRFIDTNHIDDIFKQECRETIEDCCDLSDIPEFIVIDWDATVENCRHDGFGHQFSGYDGNEIEYEENSKVTWHIFRTN